MRVFMPRGEDTFSRHALTRDLAAAAGGEGSGVVASRVLGPPPGWAASLKAALCRGEGERPSKELVRVCTLGTLGKLGRGTAVEPCGGTVAFSAAYLPRRLTCPVLILDPTVTPSEVGGALGVVVRRVGWS